VVLRLHLKGLSSFRASNGKARVDAAVSMDEGKAKVRVWQGGKEDSPLDEKSPLWVDVRILWCAWHLSSPIMNRAWRSLQRGRCDFDAVAVPDHYDPGTDDLPFVIREQLQLPLNQQFHVLEDVGKITWRSVRIESHVPFLVLLKLPPPNFGRTAGHVPGGTGGVQAILPLPKRVTHPNEPSPHLQNHLGHLELG
jgi:hypothetical protein